MTAISARVHHALVEAGRRTEKDFTEHAKNSAAAAGWDPEAIDGLHAHCAGGYFSMHADGGEDWEYGTEDRPPIPVARSIEAHTDNHVNRTFEAHLESLLRGLL